VTAYHGLELLSTAVLMLDENLHVTHANPAAETLFAQGRTHLVGIALDRALPGNEDFVARLTQAL
jgi:two-component system nitrogen regulation sensor histidine kinase GlnL